MIILGAVLLIAGFLLGFYLLIVLGVLLVLLGAGLALAGQRGRTYRGRRHWF